MLRFVPFLLLSLLAACSDAAPEKESSPRAMFDAPADDATAVVDAPEVPEDAPTVLFVGDSIGAGLHLAEHQAFPAVLQRRLVASGTPFHLVNASESGRTTSQGEAVVRWNATRGARPIDLVVIELGGNDGLRGIDLELVESNLRAMVSTATAAGARVLVLGVRMPPDLGSYATEFDAIFPRVAEELGADFSPHFLDGVGGVPSMNLADGLHPTAAGHERLADNVEDALKEALEGLTSAAR